MRASRLLIWLLALLPGAASAGGPRFVTGPPFFTGAAGQAIGWKQPQLLYYTDPGALSATVDHAAADAIVAAAAGVWNLPVASITVAQGGTLAEHVSSRNVYLDSAGLVFPADVMSANAVAIPVAVVYDSEGSVTDLLLGSGASDPSGCRQNGVTETVDSFDPAGYILHAVVVVNGRCTAAAAEAQLELQYQLMRAFGRVLGLAWSQTNDNVFTGTPTPTLDQAMNWPIMHPLDILCGPYAYQCFPSPFVLRPDDVAAMVTVYPIGQNAAVAAGKQSSLTSAQTVVGHVWFPTGEGMAGVNVLVRREANDADQFEAWYESSAVTGAIFRRDDMSPFVNADASALGSMGSGDRNQAGSYFMAYVPIDPEVPWQNVLVSTEAVNPLYTGSYSLGPYARGNVAPSGASPTAEEGSVNSAFGNADEEFTVVSAAAACGNGQDGTALAPGVPSTGWWNGLLCAYGHAAYTAAAVKPGRSFTIEVTALDEQGIATEAKAMPVIGLFAPTDTAGDLPSLGVTPSAFESRSLGTTTISAETGQLSSFWFGIADERGDGRPDFNYQARLFYADSVYPAEIASAGGTVTITGLGFRAGNAVTINGVAASVQSWSANGIVVTAPTMAAADASAGSAVDVVVSDLTTGATSTMTGVLTYTAATQLPNVLRLVSAPSGSVYAGDASDVAFTVQLFGPDGVTPVAGAPIVFSAGGSTVQFSACPAASCTVPTDASGLASAGVTPQAAGAITLQAADGALTQTAQFTVTAQTGFLDIWLAPGGSLPVGVQAQTPIAVNDYGPNAGPPLPNRLVTFSAIVGSATFSACNTAVCSVLTNSGGSIVLSLTPTSVGPITIQVADGDIKQTISFISLGNTDVMTIAQTPTPSVLVGNNSGLFAVNLLQADGATPDTNETVTFTASAGVALWPCGTNVCGGNTGWSGRAAVSVTANQPGTYTIQAAFGAVTQTVSFIVAPHTLQLIIVSVPGSVAVGTTSATAFQVQLLEDGTIPVSGAAVSLEGEQDSVILGVCGHSAGCRAFTDANGMVSTQVTPLVPGTLTLSADFVQLTASATFTAVGVGQTMNIVQQPAPATVYVGDPVTVGVQVFAPGGVVPESSDVVQFSVLSGSFTLTDWYTATVNHQTDGNGMATEGGIAFAPGPISILASDGVVSQTISFVAVARPGTGQTLTALHPQTYVAAGAIVTVPLNVLAVASGNPAAGQTVQWQPGAGFLAATTSAITDVGGVASIQAVVGPLSAGGTANASACAWGDICTSFGAMGVAAAAQVVSILSGGQQTVTGGAALAPLIVQVTDGAGNPVAAAPVSIYQTVTAVAEACPAQGRCPAAGILASQATVVVSGLDGTISIVPITVSGVSTQTEIAVSVGTQGFVSTILTSQQ
jgi:hypothetical protein